MRVLQSYRFLVETKLPFDKWPGIIEEFLRSQNLCHRFFHYCLQDYDLSDGFRAVLDGTKCETCSSPDAACQRCRTKASDALRKGTGCQRAAKEHPFLGPVHIWEDDYNTYHSLHNFADEADSCKEDIYAILPKIYRRYGFADTSLIYRDIDFFSRRVPTPAPKEDMLMLGYAGSGITLYRSHNGKDSAILLVAESLYPGDVPDAAPYADALSELLPGIKRLSSTQIVMDEDEQACYEQISQRAMPLVKQAEDFFDSHMPEEKGNDDPAARANVASHLKKLSKRHGYTYLGYSNYIYFLEKKLPNGHYICLEFLSNPLSPDADPFVNLCGLGFQYRIWCDGFSPQNPRDAVEYLTQLFDVLAEAERTVFPAILDLYPPTPDWFMPAH